MVDPDPLKGNWRVVLETVMASGLIGVLVGLLRFAILDRHGGFWGLLRRVLAATLVAVVAGLGLADTDLGERMQMALWIVTAFIADDLLLALTVLARLFATRPLEVLATLMDSIRGRHSK